MSRIRVFGIGGKFPWVRRFPCLEKRPIFQKDREWVVFWNGRIGVVDHRKPDGTLAVRPVDPETGDYYPNTSEHWTFAQRRMIPQEIAVAPGDVRPANVVDLPRVMRW